MISAHIRQSSVAECHCKLSLSLPTTCFCIYVHMLLPCDFSYIPKWTAYLQAIWSFMPSLSPMASLPSGPSWPTSAQRPYPPVSHAILQPSISTLQPLMPSTTPASLTSSPSCLSSGIHPSCPLTHALPQPSIPTLQSLTAYSKLAFPEFCFPTLRSLLPFLSPAYAVQNSYKQKINIIIPKMSSSSKAVTESLINNRQSRHFSNSWLTEEYFWKNLLRSFSLRSSLAGLDAFGWKENKTI